MLILPFFTAFLLHVCSTTKIQTQIELCKVSLSKYETDLSDKNAKLEVAKQTLSSLTSEQEKVQIELSRKNYQIIAVR